MNALKTLFVAALLVAGLYGVYLFLNHDPTAVSPPEAAEGWDAGLKIDPGTSTGVPSRWNSDPSSRSSAPPLASIPARGRANTAAPGATQTGTPPGSTAPLFNPGPGVRSKSGLVPPPTRATTAAGSGSPAPGPTSGSIAPSFAAAPPVGPSAVSPAEASELAQSAGFGQPSATGLTARAPSVVGTRPVETGVGAPLAAPANREDHATFMRRVQETLAANRLADAHLMLSQRYHDPSVSPSEAREMERLLDRLAGTVIYSRESLLEAPYEVLSTDTLASIAQRYNVPPSLLVKINGLDPNVPLRPGQQIKVVRGPFEAIVDLSRYELTLMLAGNRYAGRFAIGVGPELRQEGTLMVTDKKDLSVLATDGLAPPDGSRGTRWIGLGEHTGLHGTNVPETLGRPTRHGCIVLGRRDIEDLYDIMSIGSKVTIRR